MRKSFGKRMVACLLAAAMLLFPQVLTVAADTSGEIKLELESMTRTAYQGGTSNEIRQGQTGFSGGGFLFMNTSANPGGVPEIWSEFSMSAPAGSYDLYLTSKDNPDRGIYAVSVDGTKIGEVDCYNGNANGVFAEHHVGSCTLTSGTATLRIAAVGANPLSVKKYGMAADFIRLVPRDPAVEPVIIEGEDLRRTNTDSGVTGNLNGPMEIAGASGGRAYRFQPGAGDKFVEFSIPTPAPGTYSMVITTKTNTDRGRYDVTINGETVGTYDGYAPTAAFTDLNIGEATFDENSPAETVIRFTGAGANAAAVKPTYGVVIDVLKFVEPPEVTPPEEPVVFGTGSEAYTEMAGVWSDGPAIGFENSATRVSDDPDACAVWSTYPPGIEANQMQNYEVSAWVPGSAGSGKVSYAVSTTQGTWIKELDLSGPAGWVKLATVTAEGSTALTVAMNAVSGRAAATNVKLQETDAPADPVTPSGGGDDPDGIYVFVNQLGYDTDKAKRATVVNVPDGTAFAVKSAQTHGTVFSGAVKGNVADFTEFRPEEKAEYYVECEGARSYQFAVGKYLLQSLTAGPALDFMAQARQEPAFNLGSNTGYAWRDSHQFSFELNSLVLQYMANPSYYDNLPYHIYRPQDCEYAELRTQDEPDIVWLMQYGAMRYIDWATNKNVQLHMLIKEQLAYFLYIYPQISKYVPESLYRQARDLAIEEWDTPTCNKEWYPPSGVEDHNLFHTQTLVGNIKGMLPPGHAIVPNLMMYEVVRRDGLGDGEEYFDAAYRDCEWVIDENDITSPEFSKGQRMNEHVVMDNLTYFQEMYPDRAPKKLLPEIERWADKIIARADNMWDMRKAVSLDAGDDEDYWTGAAWAYANGQVGSIMNEPGNEAGIQAVAYSISRVIKDPAKAARLKEIGIAGIDDMFGRNPYGRAFFYDVKRDFAGGDLGWFTKYVGGAGAIQDCVGRIDASPKEAAYPFNPSADKGYTEGWVTYNTAWNTSLAYSAADEIQISADRSAAKPGETVKITLRAPLNMDDKKAETAQIVVKNTVSGEENKLTLTEDGVDSYTFSGNLTLPETTAILEVSYGYGLFRRAQQIAVIGDDFVPATSIVLDRTQLSIGKGAKVKLNVSAVLPENATFKQVVWHSSDENIASVSSDGTITGAGIGEADISAVSASDPDVKAVCHVTVTAPTAVSLLPAMENSSIKPYEEAQISVSEVLMSDGTKVPFSGSDIRFVLGNRDLIRVDENGLVTGKRAGDTTVTVTAAVNGKTVSGEIEITVLSESSTGIKTEFSASLASSSNPGAVADNSSGGGFSGSGLVTFKPSAAPAWVEFTLPATEAGKYRALLTCKRYPSYGVYQVYLDGAKIGDPIDFSVGSGFPALDLGILDLKAGEHRVKFELTGAGGSGQFNMAADTIELIEQYDQYPSANDRTPLLAVLNECEELLKNAVAGDHDGQYPQSAIDEFQAATKAAREVYEMDEPTRSILELAVSNLTLSRASFRKLMVVVSTEALQKAVKDAEGFVTELDRYQEAGKQAFLDALDAARAMLANPGNQADVAKAAADLQNAVSKLVKLGDKTELNALLAQAKAKRLSDYTEATAEKLREAIQKAEAIAADDQATEAEIAAAERTLRDALSGLKAKGTASSENPSSGDHSSSVPSSGSSSSGNLPSSGAPSGNSSSGGTPSGSSSAVPNSSGDGANPQTGTSAFPAVGILVLAVVSLEAAVLLRRRK